MILKTLLRHSLSEKNLESYMLLFIKKEMFVKLNAESSALNKEFLLERSESHTDRQAPTECRWVLQLKSSGNNNKDEDNNFIVNYHS